jgi:hypothetical protein
VPKEAEAVDEVEVISEVLVEVKKVAMLSIKIIIQLRKLIPLVAICRHL